MYSAKRLTILKRQLYMLPGAIIDPIIRVGKALVSGEEGAG
jgi:hypothetical protein